MEKLKPRTLRKGIWVYGDPRENTDRLARNYFEPGRAIIIDHLENTIGMPGVTGLYSIITRGQEREDLSELDRRPVNSLYTTTHAFIFGRAGNKHELSASRILVTSPELISTIQEHTGHFTSLYTILDAEMFSQENTLHRRNF